MRQRVQPYRSAAFKARVKLGRVTKKQTPATRRYYVIHGCCLMPPEEEHIVSTFSVHLTFSTCGDRLSYTTLDSVLRARGTIPPLARMQALHVLETSASDFERLSKGANSYLVQGSDEGFSHGESAIVYPL